MGRVTEIFREALVTVGLQYDSVDERAAADVWSDVGNQVVQQAEGVLSAEKQQILVEAVCVGWGEYVTSVLELHYASVEEAPETLKREYCALREDTAAHYSPELFDDVFHNRHEERTAIGHALPASHAICSDSEGADRALEILDTHSDLIERFIDDEYARKIDRDLRGPLGLTKQELAEELADSLLVHVQTGKLPRISVEEALEMGFQDVRGYEGPEDFLP